MKMFLCKRRQERVLLQKVLNIAPLLLSMECNENVCCSGAGRLVMLRNK